MKKLPEDSFRFKIAKVNGKNSIELLSRNYYQHFLNTKCHPGDAGSLTINFKKPTRSEAQLRYYAVVVGMIADYTGDDWEGVHEALTILKFGRRKVKIGKDIVEVRRSISNRARMPKNMMSELIEFALEKAYELNIKVPSRRELGYLEN